MQTVRYAFLALVLAFVASPASAGTKDRVYALEQDYAEQSRELQALKRDHAEDVQELERKIKALEAELEETRQAIASLTPKPYEYTGPVRDDLAIEGAVDPKIVMQVIDRNKTFLDDCARSRTVEELYYDPDRDREGVRNRTTTALKTATIVVYVEADGTVPPVFERAYRQKAKLNPGFIISPSVAHEAEECMQVVLRDYRFPSSANGRPYRITYYYRAAR